MNDDKAQVFERAGKQTQPGVVVEFCAFLKENKKYWLVPLLSALFLLGLIVVWGGTAAAPFIYSLF